MQEKLNSMISNLKGVHYFGGVGYFEKFALFNKAKLLVLPSKSDYFPSVIFEAFSSGLPVITTSLIASPVIHNENGLILDSKDISGLTKSIEYLLTNESERKRMAECAKKVSSEYSWDKAVRQISLLLR
jgi:glycosyltransferase involved in cell wall biosynthesis